MTRPPLTVNLARVVYGSDEPPLDDLAENLHEATKLNSTLSGLEMHGAALLEVYPELVWSSSRSVKVHDGTPRVALPAPSLPDAPLEAAIRERRSRNAFGPESIGLDQLATLLASGYGVVDDVDRGNAVDEVDTRDAADADEAADGPRFPHRAVPSGGGLYPLELYVLALRVDGLAAGVYHYNPLAHRLDELSDASPRAALERALVLPSFLDAAAGIVVNGVFWRSRFKYGLRGYRFTLLEAGQVTQNLVLAATALGLASCPCGGFYERRLDPLLEADGVEESALVAVFVGGAA